MSRFRNRRRDQTGSNLPVPVRKDSKLTQHMRTLKQHKNRMQGLDKALCKTLDLQKDRSRSIMARVVRAVVPSSLFQRLPSGIVEMVGEEEDVIQFVGRSIRESNNNIQGAIRGIVDENVQFRADLEELEMNIAKAEEENWSARRLQEYIASLADVQIDPKVAELLDRKMNILTPEEEETRKQELLVGLKNTFVLGEQLKRTLGEVCNASLEVFQKSTVQLAQFEQFGGPFATIRDAAKELLGGNEAMYAAKETLAATIQVSLQAVEIALDGAQMVQEYSIASADMQGLLEQGAARLQQKVKALPQATSELKKLPSGKTTKADATEESE